MLKMKEKENAILREANRKKDHVFLRCTELCAFFSQVFCNEYLEKRAINEIEPLGNKLMMKDDRKI